MSLNLEDVDTRCIADDSLPWLPFTPEAEFISVKLLSADPVRGEMIMVVRAPPGVDLPRHRNSCSTTIYTVQGRWKYREHDWVAGPGSLVLEPASVCHTTQILGDGTDDVVLFLLITGDMHLLDSNDKVIGVENWRTALSRYLDHCRDQGIEPRNITPQARGTDGSESRAAAWL